MDRKELSETPNPTSSEISDQSSPASPSLVPHLTPAASGEDLVSINENLEEPLSESANGDVPVEGSNNISTSGGSAAADSDVVPVSAVSDESDSDINGVVYEALDGGRGSNTPARAVRDTGDLDGFPRTEAVSVPETTIIELTHIPRPHTVWLTPFPSTTCLSHFLHPNPRRRPPPPAAAPAVPNLSNGRESKILERRKNTKRPCPWDSSSLEMKILDEENEMLRVKLQSLTEHMEMLTARLAAHHAALAELEVEMEDGKIDTKDDDDEEEEERRRKE